MYWLKYSFENQEFYTDSAVGVYIINADPYKQYY